ncbi:mismatch-specific DNA-glycosylase [Enemella sp. A6]|uniref:mismatch-specific DNA-glycosylase n=1 Tax=Enemella sp. A6 TaxID=3440152 RepID=UPI003EB9ECE5
MTMTEPATTRRRPTAAEVAAAGDQVVPDVLGAGMKLLIVGINPGLWSAAAHAHFARPGNRFWPAMHDSGITEYRIDASAGFRPEDLDYLMGRGIGLTNIVERATARAAELTSEELQAGVDRIAELNERHRPAVVAFCGITSYRQAYRRPKAVLGRQDGNHWVLPNPSGLNAHATPPKLAVAFAEVGRAAGIELHQPS